MTYYAARNVGDAVEFAVRGKRYRSGARKFAERAGWKDFFIVTLKQKQDMEFELKHGISQRSHPEHLGGSNSSDSGGGGESVRGTELDEDQGMVEA